MMSVRYRAFGVNIDSELPLWSTLDERATGEPDLVVSRGSVDAWPPASSFELGSDDAVLEVGPGIHLRVVSGRRIEWRAPDHVTERERALLSAGPGLAMALAQRQRIVLHGATLVAPSGQGVCLAGPSGAGKSSLAAAWVQRGYRLISDGMSVVRLDEAGDPWALPGPRQMKLWPDAVARMGLPAEEFERVVPERDKLLVPLGDAPAQVEVRLGTVVIVRAAPSVALTRLTGAAALTALIGAQFLSEFVGKSSSAELLRCAAKLAERVPVLSLERGETPAQIPEALALLQA